MNDKRKYLENAGGALFDDVVRRVEGHVIVVAIGNAIAKIADLTREQLTLVGDTVVFEYAL
jgi:hypothetical protein